MNPFLSTVGEIAYVTAPHFNLSVALLPVSACVGSYIFILVHYFIYESFPNKKTENTRLFEVYTMIVKLDNKLAF